MKKIILTLSLTISIIFADQCIEFSNKTKKALNSNIEYEKQNEFLKAIKAMEMVKKYSLKALEVCNKKASHDKYFWENIGYNQLAKKYLGEKK